MSESLKPSVPQFLHLYAGEIVPASWGFREEETSVCKVLPYMTQSQPVTRVAHAESQVSWVSPLLRANTL